MRIGVVGYGKWGRRVVEKLDAAKIWGVAVTDPRCHCYPPRFVKGIEALVPFDPTHIFVLSTIDQLAKHTRFALDIGANVFVEKPFTYDFDTLISFSRQLKKTPKQRLHINHLYRYSETLKHVRLDEAEKLNLHWEKHSSSSFSIEDNLLSHDVSILLTLFGLDADFVVNLKIASPGKLVVQGKINNLTLQLSYRLHNEPSFTQLKYLEVRSVDANSYYDLLVDPVDKLQSSIDDFLRDATRDESDSFKFHLRVADIMRKITKHPFK